MHEELSSIYCYWKSSQDLQGNCLSSDGCKSNYVERSVRKRDKREHTKGYKKFILWVRKRDKREYTKGYKKFILWVRKRDKTEYTKGYKKFILWVLLTLMGETWICFVMA